MDSGLQSRAFDSLSASFSWSLQPRKRVRYLESQWLTVLPRQWQWKWVLGEYLRIGLWQIYFSASGMLRPYCRPRVGPRQDQGFERPFWAVLPWCLTVHTAGHTKSLWLTCSAPQRPFFILSSLGTHPLSSTQAAVEEKGNAQTTWLPPWRQENSIAVPASQCWIQILALWLPSNETLGKLTDLL